MRSKSFALFLIFTLSLIPLQPAQASSQIEHAFEDALFLMYASDTILSGETEDLAATPSHILAAPTLDDPNPDLDDATMAAALQALKNMRNELDTNCRLLNSRLRSEGKDCEADRVQAACDQKRNEINTEIGIYHDLRGDKRKAGTKVWHFLKRNGRTIWRKIGPVGRTFLRRLGPEALQIVASGGSLSGGVLKKLVKNVARSIGRERIKKAVYQGVERLLKGQVAILQAAGVDICDPDAELSTEKENDSKSVPDGSGPIPDGAYWECADVAGPVASLLDSRKSRTDIKTNYYEFDHWMIYSKSPPTLHYFYSYDWSEDWQGVDSWVTNTWSGEVEDTSVPVDQNGIFSVILTWNELRTTSEGARGEFSYSRSRWGLIPPDNFNTIYLCDWGVLEVPDGLETLTAENFHSQCGAGRYYFECYLTGK